MSNISILVRLLLPLLLASSSFSVPMAAIDTRESRISDFCQVHSNHFHNKSPPVPLFLKPSLPSVPSSLLEFMSEEAFSPTSTFVPGSAAELLSRDQPQIASKLHALQNNSIEVMKNLALFPSYNPYERFDFDQKPAAQEMYHDAITAYLTGIYRFFHTDLTQVHQPILKMQNWLVCFDILAVLDSDFTSKKAFSKEKLVELMRNHEEVKEAVHQLVEVHKQMFKDKGLFIHPVGDSLEDVFDTEENETARCGYFVKNRINLVWSDMEFSSSNRSGRRGGITHL